MIKCAMQNTNSFVKNIIFFVKIFIKRTFVKTFTRSSRLLLKEFSSNLELNSIFFSVKIFIFFDYKFCLRRASFLLNDQKTIIKSKKIICDEINSIILNKREIQISRVTRLSKRLSMLDDTNENIQKRMRKRKRAFLKEDFRCLKDFRCLIMRMKIYEKR